MPTDDLSTLPQLKERHRAVLAGLGIATARALVEADRREIHAAMQELRPPRPTLDAISLWQDAARDARSAAPASPPRAAAHAEPDDPPPATAAQPSLSVDRVHLVDETGSRRVARGAADAALRCGPGARLLATVRGTSPDQDLRVVTWISARGGKGRRVADRIETVRGKGRAAFPLDELAPGRHAARVIVFAPDGSAVHDAFELPPLEVFADTRRA